MQKRSVFGRNVALFIVVASASFLFFWKLGDNRLTNWDEAWYADISRTIAEKGTIFSPTWNGRLFLEKPPLSLWLTALSYRAFGEKEFSARFVSSLSAFSTVLLVFWFVRKRWGLTPAFLSSFVLLSTPAYLWRARTGDLDSLLTLLLTASVTTILELETHRKAVWFAGIIIGLAFLTKGSIAFIFPVIGSLYYLIRGKKSALIRTFWSILLGVALSAGWFVISYVTNGPIFLIEFLTQQGEKIGSPFSFITYASFDVLSYLKSGLKFWIIIAVPATLSLFFEWRKRTESIIAWCVVVFVLLLSFFKVKSSWFLMPAYPLIAIVIGWAMSVYGRKYAVLIVSLTIITALFQLIRFKTDYFVPDVSRDEALIAQESGRFTKPDEVIYLTHYYYPTAVYYSKRITYAVYSDHPSPSWWILSKDAWPDILKKDRVFINTNIEDFRILQSQFPLVRFEILVRAGDKLLVKKS